MQKWTSSHSKMIYIEAKMDLDFREIDIYQFL